MFSLDGTTSGRPAYSLPFDALGAGAGRREALWLTEDDFHRPGPGGFPSMYFSTRETND